MVVGWEWAADMEEVVRNTLESHQGEPPRVLIKNVDTQVGRLAKALALDHPGLDAIQRKYSTLENASSSVRYVMRVLPSFEYTANGNLPFDPEVAYTTPLLAFNLGLHVSSLKVLCGDQESLKSMFEVGETATVEGKRSASVNADLVSWTKVPRYASHLRISFIKMPECGMLESLKGNSKIEADDRQNMIDSALNDYFKLDRYLARGDVFYVHIDWSCNSEMCTVCCKNSRNLSNNLIYFKVVALEPLDEPTLRVNRDHTALILGGSVASAIPPASFLGASNECMPLQSDSVKNLASVLAPAICPSVLSSKFRVSILLHGPAGCGKRTVVRYIAGRFGMHVVEYSCHDLTASSERKAAAALTNAFKTAFRY
ncbi:Peroxisome biogenesis protein 6 [Platanthera zijinensis]|uniref:Peroxisome biogenesis protein 6 n=1 Tax=Platanthera zijinensis TaxID=2320716 RepID=A0AAP0AZC1_9ASPA